MNHTEGLEKTLYDVYEAITDSAADEHFETNTTDIESVQNYASNGMNIELDDTQALLVLYACKIAKSDSLESSSDYYYYIEKILSNYIVTQKK